MLAWKRCHHRAAAYVVYVYHGTCNYNMSTGTGSIFTVKAKLCGRSACSRYRSGTIVRANERSAVQWFCSCSLSYQWPMASATSLFLERALVSILSEKDVRRSHNSRLKQACEQALGKVCYSLLSFLALHLRAVFLVGAVQRMWGRNLSEQGTGKFE